MDNLRVGKSVRQIILLRRGSSGVLQPTVLYQGPRKKRKQTRALRPFEEVARRLTKAQRDYWVTLADSHTRSNQKKRDGWARESITNLAKASDKGAKQLVKGL